MNCDNCGNEIKDFAICSDCEIELRRIKMYVYIKSEKILWTVGFYSPDGQWNPENDFDNPNDAADRVAYLNGSVKKTPVELAAEDLLKAAEIGFEMAECLDDIANDKGYPSSDEHLQKMNFIRETIQKTKIPNNQSIPKNPLGPDECKSVR